MRRHTCELRKHRNNDVRRKCPHQFFRSLARLVARRRSLFLDQYLYGQTGLLMNPCGGENRKTTVQNNSIERRTGSEFHSFGVGVVRKWLESSRWEIFWVSVLASIRVAPLRPIGCNERTGGCAQAAGTKHCHAPSTSSHQG